MVTKLQAGLIATGINVVALVVIFKIIDVINKKVLEKIKNQESNSPLLRFLPILMKFLKVVLICIAVTGVIQSQGYSMSSILAGFGIGGLAVGMAAKDTIANVFGSLTILSDHVYRIGDYVKINGIEGYVEDITIKDDKFQQLVGELVLSQGEIDKLKEGGYNIKSIFNRNYNALEYANISTQKYKAMTNIEMYYHEGIGQKEIEGTGWGVYNAITGYYSNMENNNGTKRMDTLLYGDRARKIQLFGETILAQAI